MIIKQQRCLLHSLIQRWALWFIVPYKPSPCLLTAHRTPLVRCWHPSLLHWEPLCENRPRQQPPPPITNEQTNTLTLIVPLERDPMFSNKYKNSSQLNRRIDTDEKTLMKRPHLVLMVLRRVKIKQRAYIIRNYQ